MNYKNLILALFITCSTFQVKSQQLPISNDQYHFYGPNTTWNEFLQVGGNGRVTNYASVATTNGNLHLDSKNGASYSIYLNHYSQGNTLLNTQAGNVGIGTYSPSNKFHVNSTNNGTGSTDWIAGNFGGIAGDRVVMGVIYGVASIGGHNNGLNAWSNFAINPDGGNVGIGTTSPTATLEVVRGNGSGGSAVIRGTNRYSHFNYSTGEDTYIRGGKTNSNVYINDNGGNVGIGLTDPKDRLEVNGKIRAKEIKVEAAPWPDYVFTPEYKLRTLPEVEQFIKENKHLPEIPSASEVGKEGINLGEMNAKLLKKIEELTLYLIEQDKKFEKRIAEQQAEIDKLKSKN